MVNKTNVHTPSDELSLKNAEGLLFLAPTIRVNKKKDEERVETRETILKIKDIGINRSYGFHNGGRIVVGHYYKNHRPVKDSKDIVFTDRGSIVEDYALSCGINNENGLKKLIGKQVDISYDFIDGGEYECLTRPFTVSKRLNKPQFETVLHQYVGEAEQEEE